MSFLSEREGCTAGLPAREFDRRRVSQGCFLCFYPLKTSFQSVPSVFILMQPLVAFSSHINQLAETVNILEINDHFNYFNAVTVV